MRHTILFAEVNPSSTANLLFCQASLLQIESLAMAPKGKQKKDEKREDKESENEMAMPSEGSGTFVFPDGSEYCGEYITHEEKVVRNGEGVYKEFLRHTSQDADLAKLGVAVQASIDSAPPAAKDLVGTQTFSGQWDKDAFVSGTITYANGDVYSGSLTSDGRYAEGGTYTWKQGMSYTGQWAGSTMHGTGLFTDVEGTVWRGVFKNNMGPGLYEPNA
ncbi:hypothetical protein KIPB_008100 [Kipferlia bialata]|uniref:MORN repeat-containing protein n=1 Tax=Kipferlia bialata TaxID=797122 RepID=A0A9K3D2B4_9EUKA|nr:hypothetical protein KIPB_008100 [Kipferlia bialata]|eukprot:g8100.t1